MNRVKLSACTSAYITCCAELALIHMVGFSGQFLYLVCGSGGSQHNKVQPWQ